METTKIRIPLICTLSRYHEQRWWLGRVKDQVVLWDARRVAVLDFPAREVATRIRVGSEDISVTDTDGTEYLFHASDTAVSQVKTFIDDCALMNPGAAVATLRRAGVRDLAVGVASMLVGVGVLAVILTRFEADGVLIVPTGFLGVGLVEVFRGAAELGRASALKKRWDEKWLLDYQEKRQEQIESEAALDVPPDDEPLAEEVDPGDTNEPSGSHPPTGS